MNSIYHKLLKRFADSLLKTQIHSDNRSFNGGFLCESCKTIHGRCIDAIYGFAVAYKYFREEKYLTAIYDLLEYSKNLTCNNGAIYNDLQTEWLYTTVFFVIDLVETLNSAKDVLPKDLVNTLEEKVAFHSKWLYLNLDEHSPTNINYPANNALAMLLAGNYLNNEDYIKRAHSLADYAFKHISENHLLYGEGKPHNDVSKRGCFAIDIGYNLEETLPALTKYAYLNNNEEKKELIYQVALAHLDFILPDGAIDNSFGCRNYKWTYYGSRTCDGILPLCFLLSDRNKQFLEAGYRNTLLIDKCSEDGLLYGGPMYKKHLEKPCVHHTFEHFNSFAFAVDYLNNHKMIDKKISLPSDVPYSKYYPEMDSYRIATKDMLADITCYDVAIPYSGHASGATLTMLYSRTKGPMIMGSVGNYELTEPTNMQVLLDREKHRPLLPRFEIKKEKDLYSSVYDVNAFKKGKLKFGCSLRTKDKKEYPNSNFDIEYKVLNNKARIEITNFKLDIPYILPLISGEISVIKGKIIKKEETFFLTPGFIATEYSVMPFNGEIVIEVK